jgi:SAM-dependent methyltransferase
MALLTEDRKNCLVTRHGLKAYHFFAIEALMRETSLCGRCVLEICFSSLPRALIVEDFQTDRWVSVGAIDEDYYTWYQKEHDCECEPLHRLVEAKNRLFGDAYTIFNGEPEAIDDSFAGRFDAVVSLGGFEQIGRLATVLRKAHNSLRPGGILFAYFGPIYSCRAGHHCWVNEDLNFIQPNRMPEFAHLLLKPAELLTVLAEHYPRHVAEEGIHQIYYSTRIARNMYEDYEQYMATSPFDDFELRPFALAPVDPEMQGRLEAACPGYRRFDAYGLQIVARKLVNNRSLEGH